MAPTIRRYPERVLPRTTRFRGENNLYDKQRLPLVDPNRAEMSVRLLFTLSDVRILLADMRFRIATVRSMKSRPTVPTSHNCLSLDAQLLAKKRTKVSVHSKRKERIAASGLP